MSARARDATARRTAVAGVLALALAGAQPAASGTTPITACDSLITAPGTYVLAIDLDCPFDGIVVQASNVRLVLGDHTIDGSGVSNNFAGVRVSPDLSLPPSRTCASRAAPSASSSKASSSTTPRASTSTA